jgi:hypothetical protein
MIEKTTAYRVGDLTFGTIEEAKTAELMAILATSPANIPPDAMPKLARYLVERSEAIIDILTTGPRSKPRARAINGGTKKRAIKPVEA